MDENLNNSGQNSITGNEKGLLSQENVVKRKLNHYDRYIATGDQSKNDLSMESTRFQAQVTALVLGFLSLGIKELNEMSVMTLKFLWIMAFVFLVASLFSGLMNIRAKCVFWGGMTEKIAIVQKIWYNCSKQKFSIDVAEKLSEDILAGGRYDSSPFPGAAQKVLFFVGISLFVIYVFCRMFVFNV